MYALLGIHTGNVCTLNYLHNLVFIVISAYRDNVCQDSYLHYIVYFLDYSSRRKSLHSQDCTQTNKQMLEVQRSSSIISRKYLGEEAVDVEGNCFQNIVTKLKN